MSSSVMILRLVIGMLLTVTQIDDLWNVGLLTKNISFLLIFFHFPLCRQ